MNVLLLSMPDSFEHMPAAGVRMPNGALSSLAGNIDPHHRVAVADLILVQRHVRRTLAQLVNECRPDVVGLSVMTFQRKTAKAIIDLIRELKPHVRVVVGGYDPTLATEAYTEAGPGEVDFIVRGEGEIPFRDLLRALETGSGYEMIAGLSYRHGDGFKHNRDRPISRLEQNEIGPPNRSARILTGYTMLGRQVDVIETSRGCTFDCSFCSIVEMRGRNFETFSFARVIADIQDAYDHGTSARVFSLRPSAFSANQQSAKRRISSSEIATVPGTFDLVELLFSAVLMLVDWLVGFVSRSREARLWELPECFRHSVSVEKVSWAYFSSRKRSAS